MKHPNKKAESSASLQSGQQRFFSHVHWLLLVLLVASSPLNGAQLGPVDWTHLTSANGDLPVPPASDGQSGLKVVDIDQNGQNDYVLTLWDAAETMVWYRHVGETFEKYLIDTGRPNLSHGEKFKDIDADGDLDLIIGDASDGNQINWWENPFPDYDPGTPWVRRIVHTSSANFFHDHIWGDFDGDGQDEFISWNQDALQLLLFEIPANPKNSGAWPVTQIFSWGGGNRRYRGADAADIDLDGKIDFVGGCGWFEHSGGTSFVRHEIDEGHGYSQVKAGQLIPGGRPEIVCLLEREAGPLNMYEWTGAQWLTHTLIANVDRSHTLQLGDVNQDGNLDIMYGELGQWSGLSAPPDNPDAKITVLYGDGSGNFTEQVVFAGQGHLEGQLADIDGDGDLDIVTKPFRHNSPYAEMWINESTASAPPDTTVPVISNVQASVTETGATVTWDTDEAADSLVDYGLDTAYGSSQSSVQSVQSHSVSLSGLTPGTLYHYRASSTDASGNTGRSTDRVFTTDAQFDTTAPVISNVQVAVTDTTATVIWDTDEAADSLVDYGPDTSYGSLESAAAAVLSHSLVLSGLTPETPYHYRVSSTDASGNTASSADATFNTIAQSELLLPEIIVQPLDQDVSEGLSATFSVVASGTAPLSHQWQKNGTAIAGADTASYTTPATTAADNGSVYEVVVSNVLGSATSTAATLVVTPPDSNGDGLLDVDALALGLDPDDPDQDTDNDGSTDVVEVGADVGNPVDSDGDGVIDALEPGFDLANDASIVSGLGLPGNATATIESEGETLSGASAGEPGGGPAGVSFPFGSISYKTSSPPGGSVTVRMNFSQSLPSDLALYKVDDAGTFTALPAATWSRLDATTVELTLTDGDPVTDLDGLVNGEITDPVAPADVAGTQTPSTTSATGGGGGGGCALNSAAKRDPVLPLLLLMSVGYLLRRGLAKSVRP